MYKLKYDHIPKEWINGLPISNGRLAAMYHGDENKDILSLNHEYLWRGKYKNRETQYAADKLPVLRELLKKRDYFRSTVYANLFFAGYGGDCNIESGRIDKYQPAGDIIFTIEDRIDLESSELDIENGLISAKRNSSIASEFFCDSCDGLVMARWKSDKGINGKLEFARAFDKEANCDVKYTNDGILFTCSFICGICYKVIVKIKTDGNVNAADDGIYVKSAKELICCANIILSNNDERELSFAFDDLYKKHSSKFRSYMDRMSFEIKADESELFTDDRIKAVKDGKSDVKLQELYFHYGRYLMISSCICGKLPPNLQGKWNGELSPPWNSDYHFDINLQMNEWMIEGANLSEFALPLTDFLLTFIESGRKAARDLYGCRGIWLPLAGDVWGRCTPESFGYAVWVGAAAWIAQALFRHFEYTGDTDYLKNKAYVFFKEIALFYEDFLEEDENGVMQIMPSQSPENRFVGAGNVVTVGICSSSAIDVQLAYDAFSYAIKSAEILNIDTQEAEKWKALRSKLPDFKIGSDGRLLEWNEEFIEEQPGHKHLSHLYGLYPSDIFTPENRKKEYDAAVKSFHYRLSHESGYTGWSRAWISNICARIGDPEGFYKQIEGLLCDFATESLLDIHPDPVKPRVAPDIFQIDGNFGMVSAVLEALCGFFDGKAHFLRALPSKWSSGHISGLKLPGGHTVSFEWKDCKLTKLNVTIGFSNSLTAVVNETEMTIKGAPGETLNYSFN
ncbi:MAG: hypothetical protein E7334_04570 [Clostridiales bacterium]|nr:hypothetical protein [Clostridiales bacterium]